MALPPPDPTFILRSGQVAITCLIIHEDQGYLLSGSEKGDISFWDLKTKRKIKSYKAHNEKGILSIVCLTQGGFVTQGRDGYIHFWDKDFNRIESLQTNFIGFCSLIHLKIADRQLLIVPFDDKSSIKIIDSIDKTELFDLRSQKKTGMCMSMAGFSTEDNLKLLVGYENGCLSFWKRYKEVFHQTLFSEPIMCIAYAKTLNKGVAGSAENVLKLWTLEMDSLKLLKTIEVIGSGFNCIKFRSDDRIFITGGWDGKGRIFGSKSGKQLAVLTHHTESIQSIIISQNNVIYLGSKDGNISIWNVYT